MHRMYALFCVLFIALSSCVPADDFAERQQPLEGLTVSIEVHMDLAEFEEYSELNEETYSDFVKDLGGDLTETAGVSVDGIFKYGCWPKQWKINDLEPPTTYDVLVEPGMYITVELSGCGEKCEVNVPALVESLAATGASTLADYE